MLQELRLAVIQSSLLWENPERNRQNFEEKIATISSPIDVIVLPEMFTTGFTMTPDKVAREEGMRTLKWMQKIAGEKNAAVTGSLPFFEQGSYTNRLFFVEPNASYHIYDKRHTFTLAGEDRVYSAGTKRIIVSYKGFRICPMVCYDLRFPVWARNNGDYDVLLFVANWPKPRIAAWDVLLRARAIENLAYCIGSNRVGTDKTGHCYSGNSAVFDCLGERIAYSEKEEIIYATLSKEHIDRTREKLKFLEDRDSFSLLA